MITQMNSQIQVPKIWQKSDKIDHIMDTFSKMLDNDRKDTLHTTVSSLKKLMAKHWCQMSKVDIQIMMKSTHDLGAFI